MSQLEDDIMKLGDEAITKGDLRAAFKILGESAGSWPNVPNGYTES